MNENENNLIGRPNKMLNWLSELKQVLAVEDILFLSDKDLQFLVNKNLDEKDRITERTFENWKANKFHPSDTIGKEFIESIQFALIKQKQFLSKKMIEDDKNWQRYAWIMERKFTEWNLKHISENINRNEQQTTINITAANDSQRLLIDNIINADFEEIKPSRLEQSNDKSQEDEFNF